MYSRQSIHKERGISIPKNYSGNAFSEIRESQYSADDEYAENDASAELPEKHEAEIADRMPKSLLPINIGSEELILIGLALLLFQSDIDDGIVPLLLAILFLGKGDR